MIAVAPLLAQSQSTELHIKFKSGQNVAPVYEGWERVNIPVGAQNGFDPGLADRGQPAYFYPRENHFIFKVNVPKDWDKKKELVWSISAHGKTETARATLLDVWEIDRKVEVSNGGSAGGTQVSNELIAKDQPPVVKIEPIARPPAPQGLSVLWMVYRGSGAVTFEPDGYVKVADGKVAVKATFTVPGTYTLRAFGHDGILRAPADVTVTVDRPSGSPDR